MATIPPRELASRHSNGNAPKKVRLLDLYSGMGGFSHGFSSSIFDKTGVDRSPASAQIFAENALGRAVSRDLRTGIYNLRASVVIGGPPCRPWSQVNLTRRRNKHADKPLLKQFFKHIDVIRPTIFIMENVVPVKNDGSYRWWVEKLKRTGYDIASERVCYADFGAATRRHRLITVGLRDWPGGGAMFFRLLQRRKRRSPHRTVRQAIWWLRDVEKEGHKDHVWPSLNTISKYEKYYKTGQYGWYQLTYDEPARSFGNIMKTYILHPEASVNGFPQRVLSVREIMSIMGFSRRFKFPKAMGLSDKYQAIADAVSPDFSRACADVVTTILKNGRV
jgi:DNA (cytosine-5)-methyltransferase 1